MSRQTRLTERNLPEYLRKVGLGEAGEKLAVEAAGEGNINWVRRARAAGGRSWVVKQARPSLERFPEYSAPTRRSAFEALYYETVAPFDAGAVSPRIHHFDPAESVLVLEDLGAAPRLDEAARRGDDLGPALRALGAFLGAVHAGTRGEAARRLAPHFGNGEMQRLHGDHVFHLPYRPNDFPLSDAVAARARSVWGDAALVREIDAAYARYLEPRGALVHGDVQPGNILLAARGPVLLDAEIAHVGDPAFDVGTLIGHLMLLAGDDGAAARPGVGALWTAYADAHGAAGLTAFASAARYAGIEMLRRTLGAARVAAVERDEVALAVVDTGIAWVLQPPVAPA